MTIGYIIRREREKRRLTQRQVADRIGISVSYVTKIETSELLPGDETLEALASLLELKTDTLLTRLEEERNESKRLKDEARSTFRSRRKDVPVGSGSLSSTGTVPTQDETKVDGVRQRCEELITAVEANPDMVDWVDGYINLLVQSIRRS